MLFKTDDNEMTTTTTVPPAAVVTGTPLNDETVGVPAGIIGFSLDFWMVPCAGGTLG